jgi:hypothetical protein
MKGHGLGINQHPCRQKRERGVQGAHALLLATLLGNGYWRWINSSEHQLLPNVSLDNLTSSFFGGYLHTLRTCEKT